MSEEDDYFRGHLRESYERNKGEAEDDDDDESKPGRCRKACLSLATAVSILYFVVDTITDFAAYEYLEMRYFETLLLNDRNDSRLQSIFPTPANVYGVACIVSLSSICLPILVHILITFVRRCKGEMSPCQVAGATTLGFIGLASVYYEGVAFRSGWKHEDPSMVAILTRRAKIHNIVDFVLECLPQLLLYVVIVALTRTASPIVIFAGATSVLGAAYGFVEMTTACVSRQRRRPSRYRLLGAAWLTASTVALAVPAALFLTAGEETTPFRVGLSAGALAFFAVHVMMTLAATMRSTAVIPTAPKKMACSIQRRIPVSCLSILSDVVFFVVSVVVVVFWVEPDPKPEGSIAPESMPGFNATVADANGTEDYGLLFRAFPISDVVAEYRIVAIVLGLVAVILRSVLTSWTPTKSSPDADAGDAMEEETVAARRVSETAANSGAVAAEATHGVVLRTFRPKEAEKKCTEPYAVRLDATDPDAIGLDGIHIAVDESNYSECG